MDSLILEISTRGLHRYEAKIGTARPSGARWTTTSSCPIRPWRRII